MTKLNDGPWTNIFQETNYFHKPLPFNEIIIFNNKFMEILESVEKNSYYYYYKQKF